ncbi:alpha-amylase family protein [Microbacterium sp. R86528]|uniref:alpha-amylase family protein n=1 Tax=Microbacterium sp. R86528 TaxID=3093864 RepID=UPI0037C62AD1
MRDTAPQSAVAAREEPFLPRRSVHLDFHTSPLIQPVGNEFDAIEFADRFERLGVDSVTLFAKCHHGQLYYDTDRPERHPGLGSRNLLREQVEALRTKGIRTPIYLSVLFDEHAAAMRPDWVALDERRELLRVDSHGVPGWHILDMTSPYRDYLADQITDVLEQFPDADGFFYDICFDQPGFSPSFREAVRRLGLDPDKEADRGRAAQAVSHDYMARYRDMVAGGVGHDGRARSIFFNSRPRLHLAAEKEFCTHDEVEALPTGGWGYAYAPYVARNVLPVQPRALGMMGRFFGSWGDSASIHPEAALMYEAMQMVSLGMGICIGDSLPASGRSHEAVTARLQGPFRYVEKVQDATKGYDRVVEVGVVRPVPTGTDVHQVDAPTAGGLGALRVLGEMGLGFEFVAPGADWQRYAAIVVLSGVRLDAEMRATLDEFLAAGGSVLFSGVEQSDDDWSSKNQGLTLSDTEGFAREFFRPIPALSGLPDFDFVTPGTIRRATVAEGAQVLATVTEPFFDRTASTFSGHEYTPAGTATDYPAVVVNGKVATVLFPLLEAYGELGVPEYSHLAVAALRAILPTPAVRVKNAPSHLEVALHATQESKLVHLISFLPARRSMSEIETVREPVPVIDLTVCVRSETRPTSVKRPLDGGEVAFTFVDGYVEFDVSFSSGHTLVVVD